MNMDVFSAIGGRRSVRAFRSADIEEDKLNRILEAARLAPSAKNMQEWKFVVVREAETRKQLAEAANGQTFVGRAPVIIAACGTAPEYVMTCGQHAYSIDVSIACAYMILEAYELGIGSCWLGAFKEPEVKSILNVPENIRVVALIPFGYPAGPAPAISRKRFEEIVSYEKY
jgi:nitroreductase